MGGNALKNTITRRYNKDEYYKLEKKMIETLSKKFDKAQSTICYKEKDSFGDMDILVLSDNLTFDILEYIQETFNPTQIVKNSNVYSFDVEELQIDLQLVPKELWETSVIYYSYNDLHSFIGKIARRFGLKWGWDGLKWSGFTLKNKNSVLLTKSYKVALEFLGFDYKRYDEGFNTREDIYDYIINSKYYEPSVFYFQNMNSNDKNRDKKRTNYLEFLEYIKVNKPKINNNHNFFSNKDFYLGHINTYFTYFYEQYKNIIEKENLNEKIKNIFNGNKIMDFYKSKNDEISGIKLGIAINNFHNTFETLNEFNQYILNTNEKEIYEDFYQLNKKEIL